MICDNTRQLMNFNYNNRNVEEWMYALTSFACDHWSSGTKRSHCCVCACIDNVMRMAFLGNIRVLSSAHTPLLTEWRNNSPEHSGHPPHIFDQEHLIVHGWAPEAHHFSHTVHTETGNGGFGEITKAHKFVHAQSCSVHSRPVAKSFCCCNCIYINNPHI